MPTNYRHLPTILRKVSRLGWLTGIIYLLSSTFYLLLFTLYPLPLSAAYDGGVLDGETLQTNPKSRQTQVSAIMPDVVAPSIPILVNPPNHSLLNNNQITFSWYGSTDNVKVDHYQLWLNGRLYLDNLPIATQGTTTYTLTYDAINNLFYLLLNPPLTDANYTWKIVAVDTAGNQSSSETWDFLLDTQAPIFIIYKIDTTATSISANDPSTIPLQPIEIKNLDPWLEGVGEANSQVLLTLVHPSSQQVLGRYRFQVNSQGNWQVNLADAIPKDQVIYLNFQVTDAVGNASYINQVPIILKTQYLTIPVPAIIAPPSPTASPTQPSLSPTIPSLTIPLLGPSDLRIKISKTLKSLLPPQAQVIFTQSLYHASVIRQTWPVVNYLGWLLVFLPSISFIIFLTTKLKRVWALETWLKVFWLFNHRLAPVGGVVFSWPQLKLVPLTLVKLVRYQPDHQHVVTEVVATDKKGMFPAFKPQKQGDYLLEIVHPQVSFPSLKTRPEWLPFSDAYHQEIFSLKEQEPLPIFIIPTDNITAGSHRRWLLTWYHLATLDGKLPLLYLGIVGFWWFWFPSWANLVAVAGYTLGLVVHQLKQR